MPSSVGEGLEATRIGKCHPRASSSPGDPTALAAPVDTYATRPLAQDLRTQAMYACVLENGLGFFEGMCTPSNATDHFCDPPPPRNARNRSPANEAPARRESRAALAWSALRRRVDVDHHSRGSRAPLAGYPLIAPCVVHAPIEAPQARTLFVRSRSSGGHDHAINSSTSWSYRSSRAWISSSFPFLRANSR